MPLTILHISTRLILGGSQENTVLSCEGQARRGHRVHLAFGPIYGPEGSMLARVEAFNDRCRRGEEPAAPIELHEVPSLVREVRPLHDLRCLGELRSLITRIAPDIVHTHSSKAGILGRIAAFDAAKPRPAVVHTIHGPPFMPVEGTALQRAKVRLNNGVYTVAERIAADRCHAIVSVADAMTRQYLERRIGSPGLYTTVRSGMEVEPFLAPAAGDRRDETRNRLGIAPTDFVIGTVARLAQHKGHDDLLDALGPELAQRPDWKLLWVGDGWWRRRLVERARGEFGLQVAELDRAAPGSPPGDSTPHAKIIITGLVPPSRIPAMMHALDVLAHPSYREGLPRTVPQALLAGVCPLAYDADGTREVCRDGQTGRLIPVGDTAALRAAALWLYAHPDERARMANRGRAECAEAFTADRMVDSLHTVYERALFAAARRAGDPILGSPAAGDKPLCGRVADGDDSDAQRDHTVRGGPANPAP